MKKEGEKKKIVVHVAEKNVSGSGHSTEAKILDALVAVVVGVKSILLLQVTMRKEKWIQEMKVVVVLHLKYSHLTCQRKSLGFFSVILLFVVGDSTPSFYAVFKSSTGQFGLNQTIASFCHFFYAQPHLRAKKDWRKKSEQATVHFKKN